jgi:type IV secretory pathway TrbF-like protein
MTKGRAMLDRHDALHGVSTTAYVGRQRQTQDLEEVVREKAHILTRTYQRDSRLLWAVTVLSTLLLLSGAANLWQGRTGVQIEPYVVLVDHVGNHIPVLKLADLPVTPEQSIIVGTLMHWVEYVRTISSDRVVLGRNWEKVEDYTSTAGLHQLEGFRREQKLRQQLGRRVEISPPRVLPIRKSRSYTAEWEEKTYDQEGRLLPDESGRWTATLTIADFQSQVAQHERDLRRKQRQYRNLLGIVVDDVSWSVRPLLAQRQPPQEGQ